MNKDTQAQEQNTVLEPLPSYFVAGGTLTGGALSYVERQADAELVSALMAGELCYVLDTRQVGKSSLVVRAAGQMRAAGRRTALLDLSTFGDAPTAEQWYGKLLADLSRALDLEDEADAFWEDKTRFSSDQRWFLAMRDLILPRLTEALIVFVDEIEAVRKLPFSTDAFFAIIRALCNLRAHEPDAARLTFCLVGVATPSDLIRDPRTTPFNIGRRIDLRDFTPLEMQALAQGLHGSSSQQAEQMQRIGWWTSGHPYLTQRFCQAVAQRERPLSRRNVDLLCQEVFLCKRAQSEETNLHFVRRQLLDDPMTAEILMRYDRLRAGKQVLAGSADALTDRLLLSGLARIAADQEPPQLMVRNRIYAQVFDRHWVQANLPDAERRLQRQAVRRGILRASLVWCAIAGLLLFALARQWEVGLQQSRIAGLNQTLTTQKNNLLRTSSDLGRKTGEVNSAGRKLMEVQTNIKIREIELLLLKKKSLKESALLTRARNDMQQTTRKIHTIQQSADRIQKNAAHLEEASEVKSQAAFALMGATQSGQEFEALEHGLKAVAPALRRHVSPSREAIRSLESAATAGVYRLFQLKNPFFLEAASFSLDDRIIATAGRCRFVSLWDALTGRQIGSVPALSEKYREPRVWTAEFSGDGKYLVTAGSDGVARVWDTATLRQSAPRCVWEVPCSTRNDYTHGARIIAHFSPSGRYLAVSASVGTLDNATHYATVWEVPTHRSLSQLPHEGLIQCLAFNNRGHRTEQAEHYLAVTGGSATAHVFEFGTGREVFRRDFGKGVLAVAFSRWSDGLYVSFVDGTIQSWGWSGEVEQKPQGKDWKPYLQETYLLHHKAVPSLSVSDDGYFLASAGAADNNVHIWYREYDTRPMYTLHSAVAAVMSVRFSHEGSHLVTASQDGTAEVWLMSAPHYTVSGGALYCVALSPNGAFVTVSTKDYNGSGGRIFIWQASEDPLNNAVWHRHACGLINQNGGEITGSVYQVAYAPDGMHLATAADKGSVLIWKLNRPSGDNTHDPVTLVGHNTNMKVNCVAYSPDGRFLLSAADDYTAILWDARTSKKLRIIEHQGSRVISCAFAPDGKTFVTGCTDGTTRLYTFEGHLVRQMQAPGPRGWAAQRYPWSVCFSPDGHLLLTGDADGNAYLWDSISGQCRAVLPYGHGQVFSAQFSHDGNYILTVGVGGYAVIWDTQEAVSATGRRQAVVPFLSHRVSFATLYSGQFSLDGQYVFVGGEDCVARRYPVTVNAIIAEAQRIRGLGNKPVFLSEQSKPGPLMSR